MSLVSIKQVNKKFVDIDLSFARHPATNDIVKRVNENAVISSIKTLVLTRMYDRAFHPELSSQVYDLLFEPGVPGTSATLKRTIQYVIENFEPRAEVLMIDAQDDPDNNAISITIYFRIVGTNDTIKTQFNLERLL